MNALGFGKWLSVFAILVMATMSGASAQTGGTANDINHFISAGAGIAHPSVSGAIGTNPAGQIYHGGILLHHAVAVDEADASKIGQSGLLVGGNGFFGATVGLGSFEQHQYNNKDGIIGATNRQGTVLQAGWAGYIPMSRFAFGMSASTAIEGNRVVVDGGSSTTKAPSISLKGGGVGVNLGVIFDPRGPSRFGFTAYQVLDKFDTMGFGFAHDLLPNLSLILDGTYTRSSKSMNFIPAIAFAHPMFQASLGYGTSGMGDGWSWGREGLSAAVGFGFLRAMTVNASINQAQKAYVGVTARM